MKIVFVANRFPYPPFRGDKLKIYNLVRRLAVKHELYLIAFYEDKKELDYLPNIEGFFKETHCIYQSKWQSYFQVLLGLFSNTPLQIAYFKNAFMRQTVREVVHRVVPDVVHTQHLRMSQYTKDLNCKKILDLPDAFSLYFKRRKNTKRPLFNKLIDFIEINRLASYERFIKNFDRTLVCSVEDRKYLEQLHGAKNLGILLNGVDLDSFHRNAPSDYESNETILFTGNMDYAPNVDAVHYFVAEIWPYISNKFPKTKFVIAGQRPLSSVKNLADERIMVTGFVPDICEMYEKASIVVAPLRFGAGTQNKVLESMAMGVPVVCTHIGFEGLQINSGEGVILGKTKDSFIQALEALLSSKKLREEVGIKGQEIAKSRFSWDVIVKQLASHFEEVVSL